MGINFVVGWSAILIGLLVGAVIGMFFHREEWLGGYASWQRRMLRLAHISLVATGLLNLAFALLGSGIHSYAVSALSSTLFVVGAVTMPTVCLLAAWRSAMRHLFFIPVLSLVAGTAGVLYWGLVR